MPNLPQIPPVSAPPFAAATPEPPRFAPAESAKSTGGGAVALGSATPAPSAAPGPDMLPMPSTDAAEALAFSDFQQHLKELESWGEKNKKEAASDAIAFWSLKVPAIVASASAGALGHFGLTTMSVIGGVVASVCVIVDGINPKGMLRNVHLRAWHDILNLCAHMGAQWRGRTNKDDPAELARKIIRESERERLRIAKYIADAESSLNWKIHKTG